MEVLASGAVVKLKSCAGNFKADASNNIKSLVFMVIIFEEETILSVAIYHRFLTRFNMG